MLRYFLMLVTVLTFGCTSSENLDLDQDCKVLKALKCGTPRQQSAVQNGQSDVKDICSALNVDINCSEDSIDAENGEGNKSPAPPKSHAIVTSDCSGATVIVGFGNFASGKYRFTKQQADYLSKKLKGLVNDHQISGITTYGHSDPENVSRDAWDVGKNGEPPMAESCREVLRDSPSHLACQPSLSYSHRNADQDCMSYCLSQLRAQSASNKIKAIVSPSVHDTVMTSAEYYENFRDFSLIGGASALCVEGIHKKLQTIKKYNQACSALGLKPGCKWKKLRDKLLTHGKAKASALEALSVFRNMVIEIQYTN